MPYGRKLIAGVKPGYLASAAAVLVALLVLLTVYELKESRRIVLESMERGTRSLAEAVARGAENTLRANAEIDSLSAARLLDNARLIRDLDSRQALPDTMLSRIGRENRLFRINVFDQNGRRRASNMPHGYGGGHSPFAPRDELAPILSGDAEELMIGLRPARYEAGSRLAAAVRRQAGGAIVVNVDAAALLDFRKSAGVGRLVQEIGGNPGVAYVVLQDTAGILLASRGVDAMRRIADDAFLADALSGGDSRSRLTDYEGRDVFESVMPFAVDEETDGLLRIAIETDALDAEASRVQRRLGLIGVLLVVLGTTAFGLIAVRRNYVLLDEAYGRIQTYSSRILAQMADAVVAADPEGRIQVFNRAAERLFDFPAEDAVGRSCSEILVDRVSALDRALDTGAEVQGEICRCRTRTGRRVVLSVSTSLIRNAEGRVETAVAVIQDLTEREALEANLRRRDRLAAMGELASGVAHEVRNPLNAIGVIVQRLQREFNPTPDGESYRRLTQTVREEVRRVNGIIQQFLTFARPRALELKPVSLSQLVEGALQVVETQVEAKGLRLVRDLAASGEVLADPGQMRQALLNLLENAIAATDAGEVRVSTAVRDESWVEVTIRDTGSGITQEHLERIFDLYFTTKPEGTGLGLSMVHRIIAEHGGRVEVESQPGTGSTFSLMLRRTTYEG